jgi:NADH dehydrogenase FAD-containing subunit
MSWIRCFSVLPSLVPQTDTPKPTIVVAGYGWASHAFLKTISTRKYNVKVISERTQRLNQNIMIGRLTPSYTAPVMPVIQDTCLRVDMEHKVIEGAKDTYAYDYLVVATGSEVNDFGIPGVQEHCLKCKTDQDIQTIREKCRTDAVILGAGPTGVELACSLQKHGVQNIRIVEAAPTLLPGFSDALRARVYKHLCDKGIKFYFNSPITRVERDAVLSTKYTIPYTSDEVVIWTCGVKPVAFARSIDAKGIRVNDHFQHSPFVYVLGDACRNKGPPTAQNASQQGRYLGHYFNRDFAPCEPYSFRELGRCLDVGDGYWIEIFGCVFFLPRTDVSDISWILTM